MGQAVSLLGNPGAVGMIAGGLLLSVWGCFRKCVVTMLSETVLSGLSWILVGLSPSHSILLVLGSLFVGAFVNAIMVGSVRALWQAVIQPEMQGRLFLIGGSLVTFAKPIGLAIAGPVADFIGVQFWFLIGGLFTVILEVSPFFVPVIMNIESARTDETRVESMHRKTKG
jgi:DHA3 family macrolide efflux protein-like MFS transporter